jgi:hypothetical protein
MILVKFYYFTRTFSKRRAAGTKLVWLGTGRHYQANHTVPTGFVGLCLEAAIQYSPGLQPLITLLVKGALKGAPDVGRAAGNARTA